jgi:quercetin dioxygenase-like cupin family protein
VTEYRPSPRPTFDVPTAISRAAATRHIWGDPEAGEVADWIYVSTARIHALVFQLAPHGVFRHSPEHRTIFAADELLYVLGGVMALANPQTGEVQRVPAGEYVFFRRDTWHHAFAHGEEPLLVLELFAPPPASGASGAYARQQPYLEHSRYADDRLLGNLLDQARPAETLHRLSDRDIVWRHDLGVLLGLVASTEHLTAGVLEVDGGQCATRHSHGGDEVLYVTEGRLQIRAWHADDIHVFELGKDDVGYLPAGCAHEYRNVDKATARALFAVAPSYAE